MTADQGTRQAEELRAALQALGVRAEVEVRERLALVVPESGADVSALCDEETRRQAVAAAKREGFTNLALEIRSATRATLPRD